VDRDCGVSGTAALSGVSAFATLPGFGPPRPRTVTMVTTPYEFGIVPDRILQDIAEGWSTSSDCRGKMRTHDTRWHIRRDFLADRAKATARVLFRHSWTVRGVHFCDGENMRIG
jgi:hypothetical protein